MNIAFVTSVAYPFVKGGSEKRIHEIGTRLADRGHDVTVYSRNWWEGPPEIERAGTTLRAVGPPRELYADGDRRSITGALSFAKNVVGPVGRRADRHDLLVTSVAPYFHVLSLAYVARRHDLPLFVTWHEVWDGYWESHLGRAAVGGKAVERLVARIPHHPVAVSETTARRLARLGPDRSDVTVVPNGIDIGRVEAVEPASDGFDVLFAGRLIDDKNVDLLLSAFDRVARDRDATLGIVGDGPQRAALQRQASDLDAADRISFLGFLDDYDDVLSHMRSAKVFASPSVREGFGITFVEAMAADCTVVTVEHRHSAGSEVVGDAGFVTAPTVEGVAEALARALDGERPPADPVARAERFDWDEVARRAEALFEQVLGSATEEESRAVGVRPDG